MTDEEAVLLVTSVPVYFDRDDGLTDCWFARGSMMFRRPTRVEGNRRPKDYWIYDFDLVVEDEQQSLEALFVLRQNVCLRITWLDGSTLSINADEGVVSLDLFEREGSVDFRD